MLFDRVIQDSDDESQSLCEDLGELPQDRADENASVNSDNHHPLLPKDSNTNDNNNIPINATNGFNDYVQNDTDLQDVPTFRDDVNDFTVIPGYYGQEENNDNDKAAADNAVNLVGSAGSQSDNLGDFTHNEPHDHVGLFKSSSQLRKDMWINGIGRTGSIGEFFFFFFFCT